MDATGQWQESGATIQREPVKVVMGAARSAGDALQAVNEISAEFEQRFDQDPVFRVVGEVCFGLS